MQKTTRNGDNRHHEPVYSSIILRIYFLWARRALLGVRLNHFWTTESHDFYGANSSKIAIIPCDHSLSSVNNVRERRYVMTGVIDDLLGRSKAMSFHAKRLGSILPKSKRSR